MTDTSFTSRRFAWGKASQAKKQPQQVRPQVEELEGRLVPSYFPTTANGIHIIEDQLPGGLSSAMVQFVATHTDGTQKETLSTTNQFRAINPDFTVLHYQLGTGNSAYDYIINNQWSSDFSYVNQQESWFAHQSYSGEPQTAADLASGRVGNNTGWYQADIANPAWQQYTLNQVFQNMAATGSNAWFADSFRFGIGGGGYDSPIPTRYQDTNAANPAYWPGGVTWTNQLGNWAQAVENAFAQHNVTYGTDYKFIPNLDDLATSWEPNWYSNASGVPIVDGAFLEGFGQYTDTYNWTLSMNRGLSLTDNGKIVVMQPYPSAAPNTAAGQQQVDFFLGTYLLLKGDQTYLNIDYGGGVQYYPEYQLNLGTPTTPLASNVSSYLWNGVYRRDFQNGFVLVNPGTTTYTLNLGGNYQQVQATGGGTMTDSQIDANGNYAGGSLTYQNVGSVTLTGGSAAIFLNPTTGGSLTVATPAQAAANPVTGTSVGLSVQGQENGSDSGLTYTWASSGPAGVTFSANGTNAAKNTTATFAQAGTYTFTATISDGSQSVTSSVQVMVNQTLTSLQVSPASATVADGATQQFSATALDQFGIPLATQPAFTWSVDAGGVGTINNNGLYAAPTTGIGSATVRARSGAASGSATVSVVATIAVSSGVANAGTAAILSASETNNTVTITTNGNQTFALNDPVLIANVGAGFNGSFLITSVSGNTFTYNDPTSGLGTVSNLGTVTDTAAAASTGPLSGVQRSMVSSLVYTFNQAVVLGAGAFTIALHPNVTVGGTTGQTVGTLPTLDWSSPDGGFTWVVTFSGAGVSGGSVANGVYDITMNAASVTPVIGTGTLASSRTDTFYRLYGDLTGAAIVNNLDNAKFKQAYLSTVGEAMFMTALDDTDSGVINNLDNLRFKNDYLLQYGNFTPTI